MAEWRNGGRAELVEIDSGGTAVRLYIVST
jgi:hypothetical protein